MKIKAEKIHLERTNKLQDRKNYPKFSQRNKKGRYY